MRAVIVTSLVLALFAAPVAAQHSGGAAGAGGFHSDKTQDGEAKTDKPNPALLDPKKAAEKAPEVFKVKVESTKGEFIIEVKRKWAPLGADRFYNLVKIGFFENVSFFRVIKGFMAQIGIHGDPRVTRSWQTARIQDDPVLGSNTRGMISFATSGRNTRTTQIFINFGNNSRLDDMGFAPFGKVVKGMEVVDKLYNGYGEGAPRGRGPSQQLINTQGNTYLKKSFPKLDYIKRATILKGAAKPASDDAKEKAGTKSDGK